MFDFGWRPSLRVVKQISEIERFAGGWERIPDNCKPSDDQSPLIDGIIAAILLDLSSPGQLSIALNRIRSSNKQTSRVADPLGLENSYSHPAFEALRLAHLRDAELNIKELCYCAALISEKLSANEALNQRLHSPNSLYRITTSTLRSHHDTEVFPTLSHYVIEARLNELLSWVNGELKEGLIHPLIIIGTFHLLFLQISPMRTANVRLCQLITWQLLRKNGFGFVCQQHLSPILLERSEAYYNALRQAEKSVFTNWNSLSIWLEFFLESMLVIENKLERQGAKQAAAGQLSKVQQQIVDVVTRCGSASRDKIVQETGINISTVKYNLSLLSSRGQLVRRGGGRSTNYSLL
jgi:hypothetical protein